MQRLKLAKFERVIINHAYLGDQIRHYLLKHHATDFELLFSPEPPGGLETGGGIVNDSRGQVWPIYLDFIREHPIRGVGLGTGWALVIQEPHNIVLELLGEMGLVGLAGFTVLFVTILRSASNPLGRTALVVALSAAMTQTVLFEATWWFAAGLALAPVGAEPEP